MPREKGTALPSSDIAIAELSAIKPPKGLYLSSALQSINLLLLPHKAVPV
jgi:hypothetical protein